MTRWKCSTKGCPFPESLHHNWCGKAPGNHAQAVTHQHWPKKGMGGNNPKSKIVALLCTFCHDRIDNGDWGNGVFATTEDGKQIETYRAWDLHNKTIIEQIIGISEPSSAAGEAMVGEESTVEASPSSSAPSGSGVPVESSAVETTQQVGFLAREGRFGGDDNSTAEPPAGTGAAKSGSIIKMSAEVAKANADPTPPRGDSVAAHTSVPAGYESWEKDIKAIAMVGRLWQFDLGDRALSGEKEFGENVWQVLDGGLGLARATVWNIMRVCESIPPPLRRGDLRWSHHQVIYKQDKETIDSWLDRCVEERWTIKQFKEALREEGLLPPKKTLKRWSISEMQGYADGWPEYDARPAIRTFLDWLERLDADPD